MTLPELLTSVVMSALIAALVALRSSERKIEVENITQERAKWRTEIRAKALQVHQAAIGRDDKRLAELALEFQLMLNPIDDQEDDALLSCIRRLHGLTESTTELKEFSKRVALLLKHDWERAKIEAKALKWFHGEAKREKYV